MYSILQQDKYTSVRSILSDTIEAAECDFWPSVCRSLLGQVWSQTGHQAPIRLGSKRSEICLRLGGVRASRCTHLFTALSVDYGRKVCGPESH